MAATVAQPPVMDSITLATTLTEVTFHRNTRSVVLECSTDITVQLAGTDGGAVGTDYISVPSAQMPLVWRLQNRARDLSGPVLYIAAASGTPELRVQAREV